MKIQWKYMLAMIKIIMTMKVEIGEIKAWWWFFTWNGTTTMPVVRLRALRRSFVNICRYLLSIWFPFIKICYQYIGCLLEALYLRISSSDGRKPGCASRSAESRKYGAESPRSTSFSARACTAKFDLQNLICNIWSAKFDLQNLRNMKHIQSRFTHRHCLPGPGLHMF